MSWESLKSAVSAVITDNGNNDITGPILESLINNNLIPQLGDSKFKGFATPDTSPGTPETKVLYLANESGLYANFNGLSLDNEICFLQFNLTTWVKIPLGVTDNILKSKLNENWLSPNYYDTRKWTTPTGGSIADNVITIKSNESQAKIEIPSNEVVSGQKYIMLINVEEITALHPNATSLKFYNFSQQLHEQTLTDVRKFVAVTFTANNGGNLIQVLVGGNVNGGTPVSGADLISFKSNFIGFIPWTAEKEAFYELVEDNYTGGNFSTFYALESLKAYSAKIATDATNSVNSQIADFSKQTQPFFKPTNIDQLKPNNWIMSSGGTKNADGHITILGNNSQSKIQIPNNTTVGQQYIMLAYIDNPVKLNAAAESLRFYNHSVELFSLSLSSAGFGYKVFTSTVSNVIQVLVGGNVNTLPNETPLCSFESNCISVVPWSQELEDLLSYVSVNYKGGKLNFSRDLHSYVPLLFPEKSFNEVNSLSSRVKTLYSENIPAYTSLVNSSNITNEIVNGIFRFGGTNDHTASYTRVWTGFDIQPTNYASEDKNYVVVLKGNVTANNGDDFKFKQSSGTVIDIAQDLEEGVQKHFSVIGTLPYTAGQTSNRRYTYCEVTRKDAAINTTAYLAEFEVFSLFEEVEGFTIDDYIEAAKNGIITPIYSAPGTASETYVNNQIETAVGNVSSLSPNDLNPVFDVEMFLSGGQSLNVGGGAANSSTDWKNIPTFAMGNSLFSRSFSTQAEKDAFFGTGFILMEDNNANEQYPPVTASTNTVLSLLSSENKVDVSNFGFQMMPLTWGVSGSSITTMVKGSTSYNNMIECVTKAKEFANKEGKTFGVRSMNWYHGEADRNQTKQWYYDRMSQLFIDVNTDVKAITGQSIDIQFFTYQTSPWLGRFVGTTMTHINIQEAQMQVVKDFANVNFCGAMYQFAYGDYYHPTDRAVVGIQTGVAMKRRLYDDENWKNFLPVSHQVINDGANYFINLKFDVPTKPMRFDESGDLWHNPRGKQPNFGFEVLNGSTELQTAEPFIVRGDTVVLSVGTTNPVGATVRYAVNGHDGGGNLCDSQNIIVRNKNVDYVIDNFAGSFSEYVIT